MVISLCRDVVGSCSQSTFNGGASPNTEGAWSKRLYLWTDAMGYTCSLLPVIPTRAVDAEQEPYVSLEMKMESAITGAKLGNFIERLV